MRRIMPFQTEKNKMNRRSIVTKGIAKAKAAAFFMQESSGNICG